MIALRRLALWSALTAGVALAAPAPPPEGHGFRKEELSIAFFTKVDEFLKTHVQKANVRITPAKVIEMPAKPKS